MKISFIIPTIGRDSLGKTLRSIERWDGDEILVEADIPPSHGWGNEQRDAAIARATGDYLAFMDDDDCFIKGHRIIMERAMAENPGKPNLFRMQYPDKRILWSKKEVVPGNIGSSMIFCPNDKDMLYHWPKGRNMADFIFVDKWKWSKEDIVWREEIISSLGHNDEDLVI
jgi:glycosyltransferase involved in cell wall biosynthesis